MPSVVHGATWCVTARWVVGVLSTRARARSNGTGIMGVTRKELSRHICECMDGTYVNASMDGTDVNACMDGTHVNACMDGTHVNAWMAYM